MFLELGTKPNLKMKIKGLFHPFSLIFKNLYDSDGPIETVTDEGRQLRVFFIQLSLCIK